MKELHTEIDIRAEASIVWAHLTNFAAYPQWNPFIRRISGEVRERARLEVFLQPTNAKGMTFRPTVVKASKDEALEWLGHLAFPGIFDGHHIFELHRKGNGITRFVQRERFSGVLIPLLWNKLDQDTRQGFVAMNIALKRLAEKK